MQVRDEANTDTSISMLNIPANINMEILDVALLNADIAEGEESDIGSHTVVFEDEDLNPDAEYEVARVSVDSHSCEDLAHLFFF